jgi:FkbM family methyltransferase
MLGYEAYLYRFARFKIGNLEKDKKEGDFFAFMKLVKGDGILLDVGANIGIMTYHLSKRFPNNQVLAIEPMPTNFIILKKIVDEYQLKNVELIQEAVGDEVSEIEMVLPEQGKVKMQGLAHVVHDSITDWNEGEKFKVKCNTLDEIAGDRKVEGIKMDIENFEYFALKGGKKILERDKPVLYTELWENENRDQCFELMRELGYAIFVNQGGELEAYDANKHQVQNFIFLHQSK